MSNYTELIARLTDLENSLELFPRAKRPFTIYGEAADAIESLTHGLAEAKKDADRYKWVRQANLEEIQNVRKTLKSGTIFHGPYPTELDVAIDEILAQEGEKK